MATRIALLRGINLRNRRIRMEALRDLLSAHGYGNVLTYVQSGNVVLDSPAKPSALADGSGFGVDAFVRTTRELAGVLERSPLPASRQTPGASSSRSCVARRPSSS